MSSSPSSGSPQEQEQGQGKETPEEREERRKEVWASALGWVEDEGSFYAVGGNVNKVVSAKFTSSIQHGCL